MKKKSILILCASNPNSDPRPNRMIHWLKSNYDLTVIGENHIRLEGVRSFALSQDNKASGDSVFNTLKRIGKYTFYAFRYFILLLLKRYEGILWAKHNRMRAIKDELSNEIFDLIISHDIALMPLAFEIKRDKKIKVMLDAREFYPKNFDDSRRWRLFTKPMNKYLCNQYLHRCDKIITVSDGLAKEYARDYGVKPKVVMSLPFAYALEPVRNEIDKIKMIYHGYANNSRKTELMVRMMDFVDERFVLDLMLANPPKDGYRRKINTMAKSRDNVRVIPSVNMQELIPHSNKYDIGLFLCPPTNFNLKYALPNKFFEYIQARLVVAIGPSIEMAKIIQKFDCGIVAKDFTPHSLAYELNHLTTEDVRYYKKKSDAAASVLNAKTNKDIVLKLIHDLLGP